MIITGLQKMTLLDFPGRVACTVFLHGCNFRCPFCHNGQLLQGQGEVGLSVEALLKFLEQRRGLLDGVCVTGGEPTLNPDLPELLRRIRALGYPVKLDTNGSRPEMLAGLLREKLVDYVAMDVKNSPLLYGATAGLAQPDLDALEQSLKLLIGGDTDYELRTTVTAELHDSTTVLQMGQWVASLCPEEKIKKWYLQYYTDRDTVLCRDLSAPEEGQMSQYADILAPYVNKIEVRG